MLKAKIILLLTTSMAILSIACAYKVTQISIFYKNTGGGCTVSFNTLLSIANPFDPQAFTTNLAKFSTTDICPITYVKLGS